MRNLLPLLLILLCSCSSSEELDEAALRHLNQKGEFVYRMHNESLFHIPQPEKHEADPYPWESQLVGGYPRITKEFFRCKGSSFHPARTVKEEEKTKHYADCGGQHSLPLRDGKEFIYPILIDIMNYLQERTKKRVVITCGHRCPAHHNYADSSPKNKYSKHMIGAEVSFYVQGMENSPEVIVEYIQEYYTKNSDYADKPVYTEFKRYEKDDTNVSTLPWYNKEAFIKLFKEEEGRNFDNQHPYPYIAIQVRYDPEQRTRIFYSWDQAQKNYLRW